MNSVGNDPIAQIEQWIEEAVDSQILEPNAMVISSVSQEGIPSSRVVYLRGIDESGLRFYTNYSSNKGQDFESNGAVSALFFYPELERQIRVLGQVEKLPESESDAYFNARPLESKIGAWASEQSSIIDDRKYLENRIEFFKNKFGANVPRPPHWGGYLIRPNRVEFWQGRPARLHDRIVFEKGEQSWKLFRIAP